MSLPESLNAIILKKNIFSEGNEIVTMYSRELGKVRGVARAVKKIQSKLAFGLQSLFYSKVEIAQGRGKLMIIGAKPINTFLRLRENLNAINAALFGAEVLLKATADEQSNIELFDYFLKYLEHLDQEAAAPHACWNFFGLHVLALTGYKLNMASCAACGSGLSVADPQFFFSNRKGGFICSNCAQRTADSKAASSALYTALAKLKPEDFTEQDAAQVPKSELSSLALSFMQHILERDFKSSRYLV